MKKDLAEWNAYKDNYVPVDVPKSLSFRDVYAIGIVVLLTPLALVVLLLAFALNLVPLLLIRLHRVTLSIPLDIVPRRTCQFQMFNTVVFILSLPLILLACTWVGIVRLVNLILTLPFRCCACSKGTTAATLYPYDGRPGERDTDGQAASELSKQFGYIWPFADLFVAVLGAMERQGVCEFSSSRKFFFRA